LAHDVALVRI